MLRDTIQPTTLWERAQHGYPASSPIVQFPNVPIMISALAVIVAGAATGMVDHYARAVFYAAFAVRSGLELTSGVNTLHRVSVQRASSSSSPTSARR